MKASLLLPVLALATPALAQNDECTGAVAIAASTPTAFDTTSASTSAPAWPCALGGTDIWFSYTTTLAQSDVSFVTCGSSYDTAVEVFSGDCNNLVSLGCNDDFCGLQSTVRVSNLPVGTTLLFRVGGFNSNSGPGILEVTEAVSPCLTGMDDNLEDNDTCGTARVLTTPSSNTNLFCSTSDPDFYAVTIPAGESIFVDCWHTAANGDLDVYIWDPNVACDSNIQGEGSPLALAIGFTGTDNENISWTNTTGAALNVIVEIDVWSGSLTSCNNYDLDIDTMIDPCTVADAYEDNDDCPTAVPIMDGSYTGLSLDEADQDYYAVTVAPGATFQADIFFSSATADVDLYLWDPLIACDTNIAGIGGGNGELDFSFSVTDQETVVYTNTTGAPQNLVLEVDMFSAAGCNTYDLTLSGNSGGGPGPVGTNYCMTNPNSTGVSGAISGFGLASAAANNLTVTASSLPANQFGIFIVSRTQGFVPNAGGTSNGNLCMGGQIGRYVGPGQILSSGAMGEFSLGIDLTAIPQGAGTVAAMAGDTWNFQAWHRDSVGLGSNFTDGLRVVLN